MGLPYVFFYSPSRAVTYSELLGLDDLDRPTVRVHPSFRNTFEILRLVIRSYAQRIRRCEFTLVK